MAKKRERTKAESLPKIVVPSVVVHTETRFSHAMNKDGGAYGDELIELNARDRHDLGNKLRAVADYVCGTWSNDEVEAYVAIVFRRRVRK